MASRREIRGGKGGIRTLGTDLSPFNRLAGGPIRPLWHLPVVCVTLFWAEREGFEPPELSLNCFQDSRLKPLGHLSAFVAVAGLPALPYWCGRRRESIGDGASTLQTNDGH